MSFLSTLTGSFATPAAENPTVAMVEAAYRHHGIDARYLNCEVAPEELADAVRGARAMGWVGFNCSIPHKVAVIEHLDGLGESAAVIGAVNCAVRRDGALDRREHRRPGLRRRRCGPSWTRPGKSLVMLGAGGAARAIAVEAALAGAAHDHRGQPRRGARRGGLRRADLARRDPGRLRTPSCRGTATAACPEGTDIVVNATSIGLYPDVDARVTLDLETLRRGWSSPT